MSNNSYIEILKQSLSKKIELLNTISALNVELKHMLEDPELDPDTLDENMQRKAELVEELSGLDEGFNQIFERVKTELNANRERYAADIKYMQRMIASIMEKSNQVQLEEQRNKTLIEQKFGAVKKQIREVKQSRQAVSSYYKSMSKVNLVDPQFMDDKK